MDTLNDVKLSPSTATKDAREAVGGVPVATALAIALPGVLALQWSPSGTAAQSLLSLGMGGVVLLVLALSEGLTRAQVWRGLLWGWMALATLNAGVGLAQVLVPAAGDAWLWARSALPGRATGNVRQPNLLGTLLLWGLVAWASWAALQMRRWGRGVLAWAAAATVLLVLVLVLTASRTALFLGLPVLVLWGLMDRRLPRPVRAGLVATPLVALLAAWALHIWAVQSGASVGAEARLLTEGMQSDSRLKILADAWALIQAHPEGLGWGEFNRAWTLTSFPARAPHFFDHPHNLFLQLLAELGWFKGGALGIGVLSVYAWLSWQAWRTKPNAEDDAGSGRRAAWAIVTVVGLHSMMEYPLWYPIFLLPTLATVAWAVWPARLGPKSTAVRFSGLVLGLALLGTATWAGMEYRQLSAIYAPASSDGRSLEERIEAGQRTWWYSRQADYAAATALGLSPAALAAAQRAGHVLIDTRLLIAWAKNLHAAGETDKARYLVARLQEFRKPDGDAWMAECEADPSLWQCSPPQGTYTWRDF